MQSLNRSLPERGATIFPGFLANRAIEDQETIQVSVSLFKTSHILFISWGGMLWGTRTLKLWSRRQNNGVLQAARRR
jgi:hypothetical protein